MAKQLLGKEVVAALNERIIAKAEALKANGVTPTLGKRSNKTLRKTGCGI